MLLKTIDCHYLNLPRFAAAYLIADEKEAAFIDNNTVFAVPRLMKALENQNLHPNQVKYIIITHVHLDHAGGSAELMRLCPQATLLAHPRAAKHVIDPSKLEASARVVYGDQEFEKLYGKKLLSVDATRVRSLEDGAQVSLGQKKLNFIHTRGHANHHFCIFSPEEKVIFTGDSFGLCYPDLQKKGLFIFPSTSPTDFDAKEARLSIDKIIKTGSKTAYLTHFGGVHDLKSAESQLTEWIDFSEELFNDALKGQTSSQLHQRLSEQMKTQFSKKSIPLSAREWELLDLDLKLNADGISFAAKKLIRPG